MADRSAPRRGLRWVAGLGLVAGALACGQDALAQNAPVRRAPALAQPAEIAAVAPTPSTPPSVSLRPDQIDLLQKTLANAPTHGFEPDAFPVSRIQDLLRSPWPQMRRQGQDMLVAATLRYALAVHSGRLAPKDFLYEWGLRPAPYDPTPDFVAALARDRLAGWLAGLPPPYTGYETLRHSLAIYRAMVQPAVGTQSTQAARNSNPA